MPFGGQREQPAAEDVEQDLDDIEQVEHDGRSESDLGPVPGHRNDLLGAGALAPLLVVDDGSVLLEKSHGRKTRTCSSRADSVRLSEREQTQKPRDTQRKGTLAFLSLRVGPALQARPRYCTGSFAGGRQKMTSCPMPPARPSPAEITRPHQPCRKS